jgi:MFS family permease
LASARRLILPLALAQFICSFAGSNMNVMIADISDDLDTTVKGVQTAITLFLLIMAILMIPCSKLTDRWGRKRCFMGGLTLYGIGALVSAVSPNLGVLILGNSVLEGVGTALLIPPVYILATLWFSDMTKRAWAFGVISGLGGIGARPGPLIGGVITTGISWRAAFVFQALVVGTIVLLSRRLVDPLPADPTRPFDAVGSSPVGGRDVLRRVRDPPGRQQQHPAGDLPRARSRLSCSCSTSTFALASERGRRRCSRPGCSEPHLQPRPRHPEHPVAGADGDVVRRVRLPAGGARVQRDQDRCRLHRGDARHPLLVPRRRAPRQALFAADVDRRGLRGHARRNPAAARARQGDGQHSRVPARAGLVGLGLGGMLTPSVNVVQSSFPEALQGEISGLSRSVSNLGSSFGTAIAGTILVSELATGNRGTRGRWSRSSSSG